MKNLNAKIVGNAMVVLPLSLFSGNSPTSLSRSTNRNLPYKRPSMN